MWSFPKLPRTLLENENFPNESLDQEKHFKYIFEVWIEREFEKTQIKINNMRSGRNLMVFM